ncbi:unnamed protein product [Discosporangium mesarthrocarpum]
MLLPRTHVSSLAPNHTIFHWPPLHLQSHEPCFEVFGLSLSVACTVTLQHYSYSTAVQCKVIPMLVLTLAVSVRQAVFFSRLLQCLPPSLSTPLSTPPPQQSTS